MSRNQHLYGWMIVFFVLGGSTLLAIGGWQHPEEVNVASYSIWLMLSIVFLGTTIAMKQSSLYLPLAFGLSNIQMLVLAYIRGGWTFNLDLSRSIAFYGLIIVVLAWVTYGQFSGKWNPRFLFLGSVAVDIMSFYPQWKQYLEPHTAPTTWLFFGWSFWFIAMLVCIFLADDFIGKLKRKVSILRAAEDSALSIENAFFMVVTICLMAK